MIYWLTYNLRPIIFGALMMACFVAIWPLLPLQNSYYGVMLKNDTAAERRRCDAASAAIGIVILSDKPKHCSLIVYGHYDSSGNFVVMPEMRNPFDWARYRRVAGSRTVLLAKEFKPRELIDPPY